MQYPSLLAQKDLSNDVDNWAIPDMSPKMLSVFDEMLHVYSRKRQYVTADPTSCTTVFRQIMLSMWIGFLDRMKVVLNSTSRQLYKAGEGRVFMWQEWLFTDLVKLKEDLEYILILLYRNMKALQVKATESGRQGILTAWEAEEWRFAETRLLSLRRAVESTAEIYTHAISGQAIRSSNAQSLSVAWLTTLATVFLPISLIAGIFSIGGNYAVGQSKFWVFFAVAVPVGILISFFLFTNITTRIQKYATRLFVLQGRARDANSYPGKKSTTILPLFNKKSS